MRREKRLRLRTESVQWREIDGEIVALELPASVYLAVNQTGTALWKALEDGASREELVTLTTALGANPSSAEHDVDRFLAELDERGLIEASP